MRFVRSSSQRDVTADPQTFECDLCGLSISGEAAAEVLEIAAA
jgi:hypothetical protein